MSVSFFLGVDGGGTHCRARLQTSDGKTVGEAASGPGNVRLGQALVWANISEAVDGALRQAGLGREHLKVIAAGFGLAGVLKPEDCQDVQAQGAIFHSLVISSDSHIACLGAFSGRDGAIQIIGTGSSSYAILDGVGRSCGGWGFALAEKASAAALGRDAIRAALEAHDGLAPASPLTFALMEPFGGPVNVVDWSETARPKDYAELAKLVFHHAEAGDAVAMTLVERLASDCGRYLRGLEKRGAPSVCLLGGLADQVKPYLPADITARLAAPQGDALDGALILARQALAAQRVPS